MESYKEKQNQTKKQSEKSRPYKLCKICQYPGPSRQQESLAPIHSTLKQKRLACSNFLNVFCLPIPGMQFGKGSLPHSVLFRTVLAFSSSKKEGQHKVIKYICCIFLGGGRGGGWERRESDAVKKLCRQLIGNSRRVSEPSGERQETIFSTLHGKGTPCNFCTWRKSKKKHYLMHERHYMQM